MMGNRVVQLVGLLAIGYLLLRLTTWALNQISFALGDFARWLRWSGVPTLVSVVITLGVMYFVWQILFSRRS